MGDKNSASGHCQQFHLCYRPCRGVGDRRAIVGASVFSTRAGSDGHHRAAICSGRRRAGTGPAVSRRRRGRRRRREKEAGKQERRLTSLTQVASPSEKNRPVRGWRRKVIRRPVAGRPCESGLKEPGAGSTGNVTPPSHLPGIPLVYCTLRYSERYSDTKPETRRALGNRRPQLRRVGFLTQLPRIVRQR